MKVKIISSGSKANCTLINCESTNLLIDAGPTARFIVSELEKENITPTQIEGIFITHTHSDHIKGLKTFVKISNAFVYITEELLPEIIKVVPPKNIKLIDKNLKLEKINIELLELSHDVPCYGFILNCDNKELVYITDTGYINKKYLPKITNKDFYIMETNYNDKMLAEGPYPYTLIQRIRSDNGHMSNHYAASILAKVIGEKTKYIILAHISEHNNNKQMVIEEVKELLKGTNFNFNNLVLTEQNTAGETIEI